MQRLFCLFATLALWSSFALCQMDSAALSGRVIAASGAGVGGADVTALNTATGLLNQTKTNDAGVYTFSALRPGEYRLSVRATGFKQAVQRNLELHVQDRAKQDFTLQVGSTDQSIEVTAEAPLVNSESAAVGTV